MYKFEYEIRLNEEDIPYISFEGNVVEIEHKFMFLEMTRMILFGILDNFNQKKENNKKTITDHQALKLLETYNTLTHLSDEVGLLYKATDDINDQLKELLPPKK